MPDKETILIISDAPTDAILVRDMLEEHFSNIVVSASVDTATSDFVRHRPALVLLAFKEIQKAEHCYQRVRRHYSPGARFAHRAVVLCTKEEVNDAYALWLRGLVDDYVVFWPITYDVPRLRMAAKRSVIGLALGRDHRNQDVVAALEAGPAPSQTEPVTHLAHADRPAPPSQPEKRLSLPPAHPPRTVLIVDDDALQRDLARSTIESAGFRAQEAAGGGHALDILRRVPVDLILLDVKMPDMSGLQVLEYLKQAPALARIPVVMMTGNSGRNMVLSSLRLGAVDFLAKPVSRTALITKMTRVLNDALQASTAS